MPSRAFPRFVLFSILAIRRNWTKDRVAEQLCTTKLYISRRGVTDQSESPGHTNSCRLREPVSCRRGVRVDAQCSDCERIRNSRAHLRPPTRPAMLTQLRYESLLTRYLLSFFFSFFYHFSLQETFSRHGRSLWHALVFASVSLRRSQRAQVCMCVCVHALPIESTRSTTPRHLMRL